MAKRRVIDRRGLADKATLLQNTKETRDTVTNAIGIRPRAKYFGVPAGPICACAGKADGAPCTANVKRGSSSGALVTKPQVSLWWWSSYFWDRHSAERKYYRDALNAVASDSAFWARLSEYGVVGGSYSGAGDLLRFGGPDLVVPEDKIQTALTQRFDLNQMTPTASDIWLIMLPNGLVSKTDKDNNYLGHHGTCKYKGKDVWYGVIEYNSDRNQVMNVLTHEIYEAATDPDLTTGYRDTNAGKAEIGDLCNLQTMTMDGYPVQQVWSQKSCGCQ